MSDTNTDPNPNSSPAPASPPAGFWDGLPEDIRDAESIRQYRERNDLAGLAKSFVHAQSKLGERPFSIPAADAPDEEKARFWEQLGRPKAADDYTIAYPDGFEPGELEKSLEPQWRQLFHKAHLTDAQARVLMDGYQTMAAGFSAELNDLEDEAARHAQAVIDREYPDRTQFDADERNGMAFATGGDGTAMEALQQLRLANGSYLHQHPAFRIAMARVGHAAGEDAMTVPPTDTRTRYGTAQQVSDELDREYAKAQRDPSHPGHPESTASPRDQQAWRERMMRMSEAKFAKRPAAA